MPSVSVSNTLITSKTKKMDVITSSVVRVFTACVLCCYFSTAAPVITTEAKAIMYLQQYGYMDEANSSAASLMDEAVLSHAIKDFQKFAGLAETGILDKPTLYMMSMPRCGVKDKVEHEHSGSARRTKRYVHQGNKWKRNNLTYLITKYPSYIKDKAKVDEEIAKALKVWSDVTDLNFEVYKDSKKLTIEIRFEKGKHGDERPFDGPRGTLAHAFFPANGPEGGDVHFDDDEDWSIEDFSGISLFQIAVHEFGHSLGLSHSKIKSSVMYTFYESNRLHFTLDEDDILGIQELYGPPKKEVSPDPESKPPADPEVSGAPDLCQDSSIDAATVTEDGRAYVFKGNYYWEIEETGISDGYPRKISDDWSGLPGNLDSAFTTVFDTFFFKKNQIWKFHNKGMHSGYPKDISREFSFFPNDIDTTFAWGRNYYFFQGENYQKFGHYINSTMLVIHFPWHITVWEGIPNNVDAALKWKNGATYIFKGSEYYRIDDTMRSVAMADPPYPRPTSVWWFGCPKVPDLCQDSSIDAATASEDGKMNMFYVFKGNFYWKIGNTGISDGYPRKISGDWLGLPGDLDAALTLENGKTYFFKKNQYWSFHNKFMDTGYPKNISTGFPGIPNDIDAAFVWSLNEKIYFFKGDKYWRFDDESRPNVLSHYPQPISNWDSLPNNIDAVVSLEDDYFFLKGSQYYKLNSERPAVLIAPQPYPSYPRSTYNWIFDCEDWKKRLFKDGQE